MSSEKVAEKYDCKLNDKISVGMISLGCAKNRVDSEIMLGLLSGAEYTITADPSAADVIIINTCGFIESAKQEAIDTILEMAEYKVSGRCRKLIVAGCLSERYAKEIEEALPEVDAIIGIGGYDRICDAVEADTTDTKYVYVEKNYSIDYLNSDRILTTPAGSAYLKIADGCDNFCTYCIIPKLRGKFRSRPSDSILSEAREMAERGVKEIILVAQDTACYGKDIGSDLPSLLKELSKIEGIEWIRLQYSYPENITDALIDEIASNPKIVKYIDMPLQHVSDNVLRRMGRRSRYDEIVLLTDKLRAKIPGLVIRTSLIVGFPGETEEDFELLKDFLSNHRLDKVGAFTYSREEGTPAAEYDGQIDEEIKERRLDELMSLQKEISFDINKSRIGTRDFVLIEGYDEGEFSYVGRCSHDTPDVDGCAYVYSEDELECGDIVEVEIIDCTEYDIIAKTV